MLVTWRSSFNTLLTVSKVLLPDPFPLLVTSIIHNCAYSLMEELIKYAHSPLFCMFSELLTVKIIIRYHELFELNVNF